MTSSTWSWSPVRINRSAISKYHTENAAEGGRRCRPPSASLRPGGNRPCQPPRTTGTPRACGRAYAPDDERPWNLRRVVHLHRRAGFAATWDEIQRDLKAGADKSIDRLLKGQSREGVPDNFRTVADQLAQRAAANPAWLKAWWAYRMYWGPDPLGERLTLMWHNHFATSYDKVDDTAVMRRQNEIFRERGRGPFGELLKAVVHDPALLIWLDAPANRKGNPNENLGRELMELFTLGVGHYTETDVKEAARALTGWKLTLGPSAIGLRITTTARKHFSVAKAAGRATTWCASSWSTLQRRGASPDACANG